MKIVCHREGLLGACQLASVAVAAKDIKPILRNLKAVVDDSRCTLMATDLEIGIRIDVHGIRVEEPGEALLAPSRLIPILRESTDEELTIEAGLDNCMVRGVHNEFEMPGEDPAAFPGIPPFEEKTFHEVTAGVLRDMIHKTLFAAASAEHSRFGATTGVLWELEGDQLTLAATDGRRLALTHGKATPHGDHGTHGQLPVVPSKAMSLLERNLTEPDEIIRVCFRDQKEMLFKTERAMIYTRLVEGRFPDYKRVLPSNLPAKIPIVVGSFLAAVRQAQIMTDDESKRVNFQFAKNKLTLQARGTESGRSKVELPIDYEGKQIDIGFDPKFIVDMLRIQEPDTALTLELKDSATPGVFRQNADYLYVVVPLVTAEKPPLASGGR